MSTFPFISHRMFVAAIGQNHPPANEVRHSESRWAAEETPREVPLEFVSTFNAELKERSLRARLVAADA